MILRAALAAAILICIAPAPLAQAGPSAKCDGKGATLVGTDGRDTLRGTRGRDVIVAKGGADKIVGRGGDDIICGGAGSDRVIAGGGDDVLVGEVGNDRLSGGGGDDRIEGAAGNDALVGGAGADKLAAGAGRDSLNGGAGADRLSGGRDNDTVSYAAYAAPVTADLDGAADDGVSGERDRIFVNVEALIGGSGADRLTGNNAMNALNGGAGNDVLIGGGGADDLSGGAGLDSVSYADRTVDVVADLDGQADDGAAAERDRISTDVESLYGGSGNDTLTGGPAAGTVAGGPGDDYMSGGGGDDQIHGDAGDDQLYGQPGDDTLRGGDGDDLLSGDEGLDTLDGGTGVNYCVSSADEPAATSCRFDSSGPEIVSVTPSKGSFAPGEQLVVSMHVRDASGVAAAAVSFMVGGAQNDFCGQQMRLVSGSARDGTWHLSCTVPSNVRNGAYEVRPYARDVMNNWTNMNGQNPIALRAYFSVGGGSDDSIGPEIVSVTPSKSSYAPGEELVVSMHVRDASGVAAAAVSFMVDGAQNDFCGQQMTQVSGTAQDGIWELRCTVPVSTRNGAYEVRPYARDAMNNWTNMNGQNPIALRAYFSVGGGSDDSIGPEIVSVTPSKSSYAPGEELVVSMHVRDASGVAAAAVSFMVDGVQNDFCGQQMNQASGTPQDGVWELRCIVPTTARVGHYEIRPYARDVMNNWTNMNGQNPISLRASLDIVP